MIEQTGITASAVIAAEPSLIFEQIADPALQPAWDGNHNLLEAAPGQRVRAVGDVFVMRITKPAVRENHVIEFEEGRLIAWMPASEGKEPAGHVWRWELEPVEEGTRVTHSYDWSGLRDEQRLAKARAMTPQMLQASIDRLAAVVVRD